MLMSGKEYLESIRDGRGLYVGRERIADQTRQRRCGHCIRNTKRLRSSL
jgi:aromatic ring hydroxylase